MMDVSGDFYASTFVGDLEGDANQLTGFKAAAIKELLLPIDRGGGRHPFEGARTINWNGSFR